MHLVAHNTCKFQSLADTMSIGSSRGRSQSNSNGSTTLPNREQFPSKLYEMLESVESLGYSHIVCWLPRGKSFQVVDPTQFMDLVVPKFFKATKYRSFQRQLNLWGFKRIVKGQDNACWQHEYFNRGCPQLISKIFRTRVKVKRRRATEAAGEPPPERTEAETPMQTHSDDSLEGASDYNENDGVHYSDANASGRYVASQISDSSSYFAPEVEVYEDEFDEKVDSMFFERSQSQNRIIGFANLDQMRLEPLPMNSVGILDSPCNGMGDLDEFGQLLGHLI